MLTIEDVRAVPLFSTLSQGDLERLVRTSADMTLRAGEYAVHEGGERALFAVLSGKLEVVKLFDGVERSLGWRVPGTIFGEVPLAFATPFPGAYRAAEPSRVMRVEPQHYFAIASSAPEVAEKLGQLARERIGGLQGVALQAPTAQVTVFGDRWDPACGDVRRFLSRNQIAHDWLSADSAGAEAAWGGAAPATADRPALRLADGALLARPTMRALAERLGLQTRPRLAEYDAVVVGGGPAGLAAAVYGASEGLRTLVIEREAPGGQAGTSSRIENYLGFPNGVSGDELASRALQQARRLGAELLVTRTVAKVDPRTREIFLDGDECVRTRSLILATGVSWRRIVTEGFDKLIGKGIFYGAARSEASSTHGHDIFLIGAGNSAGQAALHFANHARQVTLVVRGDALAKSMSHYLIDQIAGKSNITARLQAEVVAAHGAEHLEGIDILDRQTRAVTRHSSGGLFIFIGADADTGWLPEEVARDRNGYVLTGDAVVKAGRWSHHRDPFLLEASVPGIFACGDVRLGPVKRVASAVGEGSMAIAFVHQYLAQEEARART
jgi:thioredoxin reductase (NADPH)